MQKISDQFRFSASDLVGHLDCHHLTALDAAVARGTAAKPKIWDPVLETLAERGRAHERQYLEKLKESGLSVVEIQGPGINSTQVAQTLEAMWSDFTLTRASTPKWSEGHTPSTFSLHTTMHCSIVPAPSRRGCAAKM
jgi:hypothetical protein